MIVWTDLVDLFRAAIFAYSQACGGNLGWGIMAVTFLVRGVMLPLTLRMARAADAHRKLMQKLKPELEKVQTRYRNDPARLARETRRLYEREETSPLPLKGCLGNLVQMPILLALFQAVRDTVRAGGRFFWIGNIAKPDIFIAAVVTAITGVTAAVSGNAGEQNSLLTIAIPTLLTFVVLFRLSAGVGLYWGVSSLVNLFQAIILRRERLAAERSC